MNNNYHTLDINKFGFNLNKFRKANNYTVEQFAEIIGVSTRIVYDWESSKKMPSFENAIKIANVLRVTLDSTLL